MRRAPRDAAVGDRISLSLPAEPASVSLARTAAIGLLQHRAGGATDGSRLAAVAAELAGAGLARTRRRDRLHIHYDVGADSVVVTVELRRRGRWQPGGPFLESRAVTVARGGAGPNRRAARD